VLRQGVPLRQPDQGIVRACFRERAPYLDGVVGPGTQGVALLTGSGRCSCSASLSPRSAFATVFRGHCRAQARDSPDSLARRASALAAAYQQLGFQTLANQMRSTDGNRWMFRTGHRLRWSWLEREKRGTRSTVSRGPPAAPLLQQGWATCSRSRITGWQPWKRNRSRCIPPGS
jgi:hypothetical protein